MEPLSALSLACNILQLVEFSSKVIIGAEDLYRNGVSHENEETQDVSSRLQKYTSDLSKSSVQSDTELQDIASRATKVGEELVALLNSLKVPRDADHRKWRSVCMTIKGMYKSEKVKELDGRLQRLQTLINTRLLVITSHSTSEISVQIEKLIEANESLGGETTRLLEDMRQKLVDLEQRATNGSHESSHKNEASLEQDRKNSLQAASQGVFGALGHVGKYLLRRPQVSRPNEQENQKQRESKVRESVSLWPEISQGLNAMSEEASLVVRRQRVLRSLYDPELLLRYHSVEEEYMNTCRWIFDDSRHGFAGWLESGDGIYWIAGKAGSGKSTLMKFIHDCPKTDEILNRWAGAQPLIVAHHFFWSAGMTLQKSYDGLLRFLLFQLLRKQPHLIPSVCAKRFKGDEFGLDEPWSIRALKESLQSLVDGHCFNAKVCLFIDGLDEYDGNPTEVIHVLEKLVAPGKFKLCISSRPWPVFEKKFGSNKEKLLMQDLTRDDIKCYTEGVLSRDENFGEILGTEGERAREIVDEILRNAEGVFLWVKLVVGLLLRDAVNEPTIIQLKQLVDNYPRGIDPLYERIFQSVRANYPQETAEILWFCLDQSFKPVPFFSFLEMERQDPNYALARPIRPFTDGEEREFQAASRRLKARCMDFIEISPDRRVPSPWPKFGPTIIDLTHRTARDFLLAKKEWLMENSGTTFEPARATFRALLTWMKAFNLQEKGIYSWRDFARVMKMALVQARRVEERSDASIVVELNEMDRVLRHFITSTNGIKFSKPLSIDELVHPSVLGVSLEALFPCMTVGTGLSDYIKPRLEKEPLLLKNEPHVQCLLACVANPALIWRILGSPGHPRVNTEAAQILFDRGASPNQRFLGLGGLSPWNHCLERLYDDREEILRWKLVADHREMVRLFLENGADTSANLVRGSESFTVEQVLGKVFPPDDSVFQLLEQWRHERLKKRTRLKNVFRF